MGEVEVVDRDIESAQAEIEAARVEAGAAAVIRKIKYDAAHNELIRLLMFQKVKDEKTYRKAGMTFAEFCKQCGESVRTIDAKLQTISPMKEFSANLADFFEVPFSKIKLLGNAISANFAEKEDGHVVIGNHKIEFRPENMDTILAAIETRESEHKKQVEDKEKDISALRRMNEDKEKQIQKLHKEIEASDAAAKKAGYANVTEAKYIKKIDNLRTRFAGLMLELDPEDRLVVPDDATVSMKAAYTGLLEEMRNKVLGFWDTASIHRPQRPEWNPDNEIAGAEE